MVLWVKMTTVLRFVLVKHSGGKYRRHPQRPVK